jgi:hypothetical protein
MALEEYRDKEGELSRKLETFSWARFAVIMDQGSPQVALKVTD